MANQREDSLSLQLGDYIIWQGEKIYGDRGAHIEAGMVGKVVSLRAGIPIEDPKAKMMGRAVPPRALVEFENEMQLLVDRGMNFEKIQMQ